jgi:hypothetical protein
VIGELTLTQILKVQIVQNNYIENILTQKKIAEEKRPQY